MRLSVPYRMVRLGSKVRLSVPYWMVRLELVTIKNEILEVPNLKLVFLTFERSEIWQKLKNKQKRLSFQLYRDSNLDCQIYRQLSLPLYQIHLINNYNREIRQHCNFCQISLLSKVRKTSLRLGTFKISFLIVTNSKKIGIVNPLLWA